MASRRRYILTAIALYHLPFVCLESHCYASPVCTAWVPEVSPSLKGERRGGQDRERKKRKKRK